MTLKIKVFLLGFARLSEAAQKSGKMLPLFYKKR